MPLITVQIIENVFTAEQKKQIITKMTDAMVAIEGEALRGVTWVKIDEIKEGNWGIGGQPLHARDVHRMQKAAV
jgi:4-oxalocrotonate tautomerase